MHFEYLPADPRLCEALQSLRIRNVPSQVYPQHWGTDNAGVQPRQLTGSSIEQHGCSKPWQPVNSRVSLETLLYTLGWHMIIPPLPTKTHFCNKARSSIWLVCGSSGYSTCRQAAPAQPPSPYPCQCRGQTERQSQPQVLVHLWRREACTTRFAL